jgi:hypothetical protein
MAELQRALPLLSWVSSVYRDPCSSGTRETGEAELPGHVTPMFEVPHVKEMHEPQILKGSAAGGKTE